MIEKKLFTFSLCASLLVFSLHSKDQQALRFDTSSSATIAAQVMTHFFQMDEIAKTYCQQYSSVLPIWCGKCKKRKLYLGEFSGCLLALILKNAADKKEVERLASVFENFLKILTTPKPQESIMVDFVVKEMKNIEYLCTECHSNTWEVIPNTVKAI